MIRVESITIQEFRGIRDLTIDFKDKNFAICGPNGTGKSGIVDALEFALTGSISRLSGKGTGGISVKDHAPHVDSRNRPDKCLVRISVNIPKLGKVVTVERTVKSPLNPITTPNDADVLEVLNQVAQHPEFALSRRELITYVLSTPGDRATEVQILLKLDEVEKLRTILQKISNAAQRDIAPLSRERVQAQEQLLQALGISALNAEKLLEAVNARRLVLGLGPIPALTTTTSFRDGLVAGPTSAIPARVPKVQAAADIQRLKESLAKLTSDRVTSANSALIEELAALSSDPAVSEGVTREAFLQTAISLLGEEKCPVCDTPWKIEELRAVIAAKLKHFEEVSLKRDGAEKKLVPLLELIGEISAGIASVQPYAPLLNPPVDPTPLRDFRSRIEMSRKALEAFLPLASTIVTIKSLVTLSAEATATISALEAGVAAIPEPTQQDAAREYLTICQERLEAYRGISLRTKRAEEYAAQNLKIYETYASVSTKALEGIYKEVEKDFSELYRYINRDDEGDFAAHLTPSIGKLGFDVDFYGRGFFPPGAYHSEGHQDGMGLCLYLALMKHLLGDAFSFAVLDDVLMSVDSGHRRQVCNLLKEKFPETQFILTTHDEIWLRHMKSAGLISSQSFIHFRNWDVDQGPTEWDDRDVWTEIEDTLKRNEVRAAAGLLRHYLEFISAEICHRLRAPVEFRGDAQFQLGDLLPAAIGQFGKLLREGKAAAQSWGQADKLAAITTRETEFKKLVADSKVEQWQVNTAIHYNQWENLQKADFEPVTLVYRNLTRMFVCPEAACGGLLYVMPERGQRETMRCACGVNEVNLRAKA